MHSLNNSFIFTVKQCLKYEHLPTEPAKVIKKLDDDDDQFRFNDRSTHEVHLRQNGELTWFCNETVIMMSYMHKI